MKNRMLNIQLLTASILSLGGLAMLFCGVYIDPLGQIHESLLIGFGEVATFAGALFGIDYTYKIRNYENRNTDKNSTGRKSRTWNYRPAVRDKDAGVSDA